MKKLLTLVAVAFVVFAVILTVVSSTKDSGKTENQVSQETATEKLERLIKKVDVEEKEPRKSPVTDDAINEQEELPNIDQNPIMLEGNGEIDIEIFSSPEKAGTGTDGWMIEIGKKFNAEKYEVDGKRVSVSIRKMDSGTGVDYVATGRYMPDAFAPSNELWGEMLKAKKVNVTLKTNRLVGNTAGVLLKQETYDKLVKKYGSVNLKTVVEATANNEITMGYTNPLASSSGLNFILSTLYSFNYTDPFSTEAVDGFMSFQANVPLMAQTTMQLRQSALSGSLDALILEYQSLQNLPELKSFVFTPYGVRHDEPLYSLTQSEEKNQVIDLFVEYCASEESQKLATEYGFNGQDDYVSELPVFSGEDIIRAQALWKEKKNSEKNVIAVFVADTSGSMRGEAINNLKKGLINAAKYINSENSIGLIAYNSRVYKILPIKKFDLNQRAYFQGAVEDLSADGGTTTYNAIIVAVDMLMKEKAKEENKDAELRIFLLSDGKEYSGLNLNDIRSVLEGTQIPVYTIGYNANIPALKEISQINEAASIDANSENVVYQLKQLFNAQT